MSIKKPNNPTNYCHFQNKWMRTSSNELKLSCFSVITVYLISSLLNICYLHIKVRTVRLKVSVQCRLPSLPMWKFPITHRGKWNLKLIFSRYILTINSVFPQSTHAESNASGREREKKKVKINQKCYHVIHYIYFHYIHYKVTFTIFFSVVSLAQIWLIWSLNSMQCNLV